MKMKRLMSESMISILIGAVFFVYRWWMFRNMPDFGGKDFVYSMILVPVFYFVLAYILGRWVFHFTVCAVHKKGIRILFFSEVAVLCLHLVCVVFTGVMKYVFTQYTVTENTYTADMMPWLKDTFWQSWYVHIFAFGGSAIHVIICVFAGILFALAITGKALERC
ncbi:MAG: hypothetical protein J6K48_06590 [Lachnospiraceae bacterium]|nr:hypothetical protein [Lachnospiraceae bacterium]